MFRTLKNPEENILETSTEAEKSK